MKKTNQKEHRIPKTAKEILFASPKSLKYIKGASTERYLQSYHECVVNMITVKEATMMAGSFANKCFEAGRIVMPDNLVMARYLGNLFQRFALDVKHSVGEKNYREEDVFKIIDVFVNRKYFFPSEEAVYDKITDILDGRDIKFDKMKELDNMFAIADMDF